MSIFLLLLLFFTVISLSLLSLHHLFLDNSIVVLVPNSGKTLRLIISSKVPRPSGLMFVIPHVLVIW